MARFSLQLLALFLCCYVAFVNTASLSKVSKKDRTLPKTAFRAVSNPTDAFCKKFIAQCYRSALAGKTGNVQVIHACRRNGNKYSSSFSFGCKADGMDVTQDVLNKMGSGITVTNNQGSTVVVQGTVTNINTSTAYSTVSSGSTVTVLSPSVVGTVSSSTTSTAFALQTSIITTAVPVTLTSTSTQVISSTIPVTITVATSTVTTVTLGVDPVPIIQVVLGAATRKRLTKIDNSQFCSSFSTSCSNECARVNSTPKHVVCQSTGARSYSLTCYCKNRKVETQHALAAVAQQESIVTVSTVATSTNYATATATTVVPTTVVTTAFSTATSTVAVTSTYVSSTVLTLSGTATAIIGVPTVVATTIPTVTTTARITSVSAVVATSTTQIILAPTGAVQLINTADGSQRGYISYSKNSAYFYYTTDKTAAVNFLAVRDPISGLYQLQLTDGSSNVFISESGLSGADFIAKPDAFAWTYPGPASLCGAAGLAAAIPAGKGSASGKVCETFIFSPGADSTTLALGTSIALGSTWVNPTGVTSSNLAFTLRTSAPGLYQVANPAAFANTYGATGNIGVSLRFPA